MAAQFASFRARLGRLFGGLPLYVGHPDLANANELADRKAYGWILELDARDDGLYGRAKWSEAGVDLLRNAHFKFLSPFWEAREIGFENGRRVYKPVALISAGLTNQPNIPVRPLANENREEPPAAPAALDPIVVPAMHTISHTERLGLRRGELEQLQNRRDRIQECVLAKMRLGLSYDEAWESAKREHAGWFAAD
jgi:phage I-like protein